MSKPKIIIGLTVTVVILMIVMITALMPYMRLQGTWQEVLHVEDESKGIGYRQTLDGTYTYVVTTIEFSRNRFRAYVYREYNGASIVDREFTGRASAKPWQGVSIGRGATIIGGTITSHEYVGDFRVSRDGQLTLRFYRYNRRNYELETLYFSINGNELMLVGEEGTVIFTRR